MLEPDSAVDAQGGTGDVIGIVGGKEHGGLADVLGHAKATPGERSACRCHHLVTKRFVLTGRIDPAWLDDVDVDSVRIELSGDRKGHLVQSSLTGVIGHATGVRSVDVAARDEDD